MEKIKIVAIVGKSGSGKTCMSMVMPQIRKGFNTIVSYTTRPMRPGEKQGVDHWFVHPQVIPPFSEMVAYTVYGDYEYWTTWDQFQENCHNVYVIDEDGLLDLMIKPEFSDRVDLTTVKVIRPVLKNIDSSRIARDSVRKDLEDSFYDYVVLNDGTLENFKDKIIQLCNEIKNSDYGNSDK